MAYLDSSNVQDLVADIKVLADDEYAEQEDVIVSFAYCGTAANVAEKTSTTYRDTFRLENGAVVIIYFANDNTAANPTLNVNNTGAYPMYNYSTNPVAASDAKDGLNRSACYAFAFRNNAWFKIGFMSIGNMSQSDVNTGTSEASMTISPKILKYAIENLAPTEDSGTGYCKMPNGTLIQWGKAERISVNLTAAGSLFCQAYTLTFPQEFYDANISVSASFGYGTGMPFPAGVVYGGLTKTNCTLGLWDIVARSGSSGRIVWQAIGRWK